MLNLSPQYAGCHDIPAFAGFSAPCSFNMRAFAFRIPARWGVGRKRRKISKGSHFKPSHCLPVNGRARSVVLLVSLRLRAGGRLAGLAPSSQRGVMKCGLALLYHRLSPLQKGISPQRRGVRSGGFRIASCTGMLRHASLVVRFFTLCALGVSAVRFCSEVIDSECTYRCTTQRSSSCFARGYAYRP